MRPWIAALVAFVFLGPYLAGSWEIAQEIDANATGPLRLGVAAVASLSLPVDQGAWVQLDDAVCNRDRAVRIGGAREEPPPPPEPGPMTGLLYRAKVHELRDLEAAGFFGPAGPPRGPLYVLFARFGPDHLVLRQRLGLVFVCG